MTTQPLSPWSGIKSPHPGSDSLSARVLDATSPGGMLAAIDSSGVRHYLVPLNTQDTTLSSPVPRGLEVSVRDFRRADSHPLRYFDIACADPGGSAAFDLVGADLLATLRDSGDAAPKVVSDVLARWRRFWTPASSELLTAEEQRGLFLEILFMVDWLIPAMGVAEAVASWRGPYGSPHDFVLPDASVEVKSTISSSRKHKISGFAQLEPLPLSKLFLFSSRLAEIPTGDSSLSRMVEQAQTLLSSHPSSLELFESALLAAGYDHRQSHEYSTPIATIAPVLYEVAEDFPRLSTSLLPRGIPAGVVEIGYTVDLEAFDHLVRARAPEEMESALRLPSTLSPEAPRDRP